MNTHDYRWFPSSRVLWVAALAALALSLGACKSGPPSSSTAPKASSDHKAQTRTYAVTVGVSSDSGSVAALQFDIKYKGEGGFVGDAGDVECESAFEGSLATFNNKGDGLVSGAIIDLAGFSTPTEVATCSFRTKEDPSKDSFEVTAVDSSDADSTKIEPAPVMVATAVKALD
ncbi:MAG: hypothetical protein ACE5E4_02135 [Candidatus Binatia bacterium]